MHSAILCGLALLALVWQGSASQTPKCTDVTFNKGNTNRNINNPSIMDQVTSMSVKNIIFGSLPCIAGNTYGFVGTIAWVERGCKATFRVCGVENTPESTWKACQLDGSAGYDEKPVTGGDVVAMHVGVEHSNKACKEGVSYGYDNKKHVVFATNGCKARFEYHVKAPKEILKCRTVNMNHKTTARTEENPPGMKEIQSMELVLEYGGKKNCKNGDTFGFAGEVIFTQGMCRGSFTVCGKTTDADEKKDRDDRLNGMFGGDGKTTDEVKNELAGINKEKYKGKCTCTTWGDPHFKGFDGATIHFMGICEYTLVRTTDHSLGECTFDVTTEHERRHGSTTVSYVKRVNIIMFGKEIQLGKNRHLVVDGVRKRGFRLEDKIKITSCGVNDLIFKSERCGVTIAYRKNNRVEVTVNGRYKGHMEGMCGNCNQDRADDLLLSTGKTPSGATNNIRNAEIGNSWLVRRDREGLPDSCREPEVKPVDNHECDKAQTTAAEEKCEPMRNEKGPFKDCLNKAGSSLLNLFEGCVTDVCTFHKDEEEADKQRCKNFETMAQECMKLGILTNYREETDCGMTCPANFDYFEFVPDCQPTCDDLEPKGACLKETSEGCICAEGMVLDGNTCVERKLCGCKKDGHYITMGESILSNDCKKILTCSYDEDKDQAMLITKKHQCGKNAHCGRVAGEKACKCNRLFKGDGQTCEVDQDAVDKEKEQAEKDRQEREETMCTCSPWGDPHYRRYDGDNVDFMGTCTYLISGTKTTGGKCDFAIKTKNENRGGNTRVAFTRDIYIEYRGVLVEMKQGRVVKVNGAKKLLPYENSKKDFTIQMRGKYAEFLTGPECNVQVSFDGNYDMVIKIPKRIGEDVIGLCDNCDGVKTYKTREGEDTRGKPNWNVLIGNSWKVPNPVGLKEAKDCAQVDPVPDCTKEQRAEAESADECGRINDPNGPFAACYKALANNDKYKTQADEVYDSCKVDFCAYVGNPQWESMRCSVYEEMASICAKIGISVTWRTADLCPLDCPKNSVYNPLMFGCQPTCLQTKRPKICMRSEIEGCECLDGFVLDKGVCIPEEECGCRDDNGDYVPVGSKFVSEDCTTIIECKAGDGGATFETRTNEHGSCHVEATCELDKNHNPICVCNEGFEGNGYKCEPVKEVEPPTVTKPAPTEDDANSCLCKANGDPRVIQFDKGRLWVNNPCKFTLVKSTDESCDFEVEMKTVSHTVHPHMSYIHEIDIKHDDVTLRVGQALKVQVHTPATGKFEPLNFVEPTQVSDNVWIKANASGVSVSTECGLVVLFDGEGEVTTTVPQAFAPAVTGLCGNCDGDQSNDRLDENGNRPSHYATREEGHNAVARMHMVPDDSSDPDLSDVCSVPTEERLDRGP